MSVFVNKKKCSMTVEVVITRVYVIPARFVTGSHHGFRYERTRKKKNNPSRVDIIYDVLPHYPAHPQNHPRSILGYTDSLIRPTCHFSQFVWDSCNFFFGSRVTKFLDFFTVKHLFILRNNHPSFFLRDYRRANR